MDTNMFSTFVQDDWQIAPTVKVLYGRPLRPLPLPGGPGERAARPDAQLQHRQEQLGPARRRGLGGVADDGACAAASASCTTSRFSAATSRRCRSERIAEARRPTRSTARPPAPRRFPASAGTGTLAHAVAVGGRPGFPGRAHHGRPTRSSSGVRPRLHGFGRLHVREGVDNLPVVTDVNLDRPDSARWPTAGRSTARRPTRRRVSIRGSTASFEVQSIGDSTFKSHDAAGVEAAVARA